MTDVLRTPALPFTTDAWLEEKLELAAQSPTESRRAGALHELEQQVKRDARLSVEAEIARLEQETAARLVEARARQQADLERARAGARRSERRFRIAGLSIGCLLLAGAGLLFVTRGSEPAASPDVWQGVEQAARQARAARDELAKSTHDLREAERKARLREQQPTTAKPELVPVRETKLPRTPPAEIKGTVPARGACTGDPNDPLNPQLGC
jgi:hypothetical protein